MEVGRILFSLERGSEPGQVVARASCKVDDEIVHALRSLPDDIPLDRALGLVHEMIRREVMERVHPRIF